MKIQILFIGRNDLLQRHFFIQTVIDDTGKYTVEHSIIENELLLEHFPFSGLFFMIFPALFNTLQDLCFITWF